MSLQWVLNSKGRYPQTGTVHAGVDSGKDLYVARGTHDGAIVPGKLHVGHKGVYIPHAGEEVTIEDNYQVLVAPPASLSWVESGAGGVPKNAVVGGRDKDREELYIGRVIHGQTVTTGKVKRSHKLCYFAYGGKELNSGVYEVLVINAYGKLLGLSPNLS